VLLLILFSHSAKAQDSILTVKKHLFFSYDSLRQVDILDIARHIFRKKTALPTNTIAINPSHVHVTAIPAAGYSLQTGWAGILSANIAFTGGLKENISSITSSFTYSQYKQYIVPLHTNIWSKNGKYNFQSEWRFLKYPSFTYGLGTRNTLDNGYMIDYSYLRLQQDVSREITKNLYAGMGIDLDFFWNITETNPPSGTKTDFESYGLSKRETAIGPAFNLLYDSRKNPINPQGGNYLEFSYRPKFRFMGSDANWQSLLIDYRGYKKFPANSNNIIAVWSYNWFTFAGKPPYLLLPSTGWDAFVNTGRGFIQGRYRGDNMLYAEAEYRFSVTSNGLFGGVVFANAETFSSRTSTLNNDASFKTFDPVQPGYGVGIRIKINKFSGANLCIDYGWGTGGSRGVAVNLGEVF
jgi:Omp85 superfamily domain